MLERINKILNLINRRGFKNVSRVIYSKYFGKYFNCKIKFIQDYFNEKSGIEIGGPSGIFMDYGYIPIYKNIKSLDGCNFSNTTIWEGNINQGRNYNYYKNRLGYQYISEATDLNGINDDTYEFLISSNCLEHVANPLKAVQEWVRIVKNNGLILLILPKKEKNFDHYRSVTSFAHLQDDYKNNISEDDLTHLPEILKLHDLKMEHKPESREEFEARALKNFQNRSLHQHIFDLVLLQKIFDFYGIETLYKEDKKEHVILGKVLKNKSTV